MGLQEIKKSSVLKKKQFIKSVQWEKIFACYTSSRGILSGIYKELKIRHNKKSSRPINKLGNETSKQFSKGEIEMVKKHEKWPN